MRRRQPQEPATPKGIPTDLAAGPCIELWADPEAACPSFSARRNWKDARNAWAKAHGLADDFGRLDYRRLPRELRDRAPFYRDRRNNP